MYFYKNISIDSLSQSKEISSPLLPNMIENIGIIISFEKCSGFAMLQIQ